jgi:hypothetical protein
MTDAPYGRRYRPFSFVSRLAAAGAATRIEPIENRRDDALSYLALSHPRWCHVPKCGARRMASVFRRCFVLRSRVCWEDVGFIGQMAVYPFIGQMAPYKAPFVVDFWLN